MKKWKIFTCLMCTLMICFITLSSTGISVYAAEVTEDEENVNVLKELYGNTEKYFYQGYNGNYFFNYELAVQDCADNDVLKIGKTYNQMKKDEIRGNYKKVNRVKSSLADKVPKYGNWCGKGNNGKKPIDILDKQCMIHDKCYDKNGQWNTKCDVELVWNIARDFGKIRKCGVRTTKYAVSAMLLFAYKVGGTTALKTKFPILIPFLP